jgi:hypothetical protein
VDKKLITQLVAGFFAICSVAVSGYFSAAANARSEANEQAINSINFLADTVDPAGQMAFTPMPAGSGWPGAREWKKVVRFDQTNKGTTRPNFRRFSYPPKVFVNLKSFDQGDPMTPVRISIGAPEEEIGQDSFVLHIVTWSKSKPAWVEVSWFAYDYSNREAGRGK